MVSSVNLLLKTSRVFDNVQIKYSQFLSPFINILNEYGILKYKNQILKIMNDINRENIFEEELKVLIFTKDSFINLIIRSVKRSSSK